MLVRVDADQVDTDHVIVEFQRHTCSETFKE